MDDDSNSKASEGYYYKHTDQGGSSSSLKAGGQFKNSAYHRRNRSGAGGKGSKRSSALNLLNGGTGSAYEEMFGSFNPNLHKNGKNVGKALSGARLADKINEDMADSDSDSAENNPEDK